MEMRDFVVRFAGEGGQGVVTSAEGLAQTATQAGYHALTFATFPSQILGGPTWTQARISVDHLLSPGDDVDVLVSPVDCWGRPHRACAKRGVPIIFVGSNVPVVRTNPERRLLDRYVEVTNYAEAAGVLAAMSSNVSVNLL